MEETNKVSAPSRERECVGALETFSRLLIILGWIALPGVALLAGSIGIHWLAAIICGVLSWLGLSLSGVIVRGFSYVVDAAIIYRSKNSPERGE